MTNADKKTKPGDATYVQRVEMMCLLAEALGQVGIAVVDEPTFAGKAKKLRTSFLQRLPLQPEIELYFLLGWDTVTRLFNPRFYRDSEEEMAHTLSEFFKCNWVVCARRPTGIATAGDEENSFLNLESVRPYYEAGKILVIDLSPSVGPVSSTAVRNIAQTTGVGKDKKERLMTLVPEDVGSYVFERHLYEPIQRNSVFP